MIHLFISIIDNQTKQTLENANFYGADAETQYESWRAMREHTASFGPDQAKDIVVTDLTASDALDNGIKEGLYAQLLGNQVVALVYYVNATSGFDAAKLMQIMQDPSIAIIERLLRGGALEQAQTLLGSIGNAIYSPAQISQISAFIDKQVAIRDQFDPTKA